MQVKKIFTVVGTRPNFIKVTRFKTLAASLYPNLQVGIVHTGQHYDEKMSQVFFEQFNLVPDFFLNIGAGSQNHQLAQILLKLEPLLLEHRPDLLMVVGDVNSTLAAALCANKCGIKIAHLESGLRSRDMEMPEEINRILTDKITSMFFVTEKSGLENLAKEGLTQEIHLVGNTMIDTMVAFEKQIQAVDIKEKLNIQPQQRLVLMTIHRPSNVDTIEGLNKLAALITQLVQTYQVVFPVHPRTRKNLEQAGLSNSITNHSNLVFCDPLDYFTFQKLIALSSFVITDSGGVQEETTFRKVPCITLRNNTERPVTVEMGTNVLLPFDNKAIFEIINQVEKETFKKGEIPPMWDGHSTERILQVLSQRL